MIDPMKTCEKHMIINGKRKAGKIRLARIRTLTSAVPVQRSKRSR